MIFARTDIELKNIQLSTVYNVNIEQVSAV